MSKENPERPSESLETIALEHFADCMYMQAHRCSLCQLSWGGNKKQNQIIYKYTLPCELKLHFSPKAR